jgi:hypothetical protein
MSLDSVIKFSDDLCQSGKASAEFVIHHAMPIEIYVYLVADSMPTLDEIFRRYALLK